MNQVFWACKSYHAVWCFMHDAMCDMTSEKCTYLALHFYSHFIPENYPCLTIQGEYLHLHFTAGENEFQRREGTHPSSPSVPEAEACLEPSRPDHQSPAPSIYVCWIQIGRCVYGENVFPSVEILLCLQPLAHQRTLTPGLCLPLGPSWVLL